MDKITVVKILFNHYFYYIKNIKKNNVFYIDFLFISYYNKSMENIKKGGGRYDYS